MTITRPRGVERPAVMAVARHKFKQMQQHLLSLQLACMTHFFFSALVFFCIYSSSSNATSPPSRRALIKRRRQAWRKFIRPIIADGSFRLRYRMRQREFNKLYGMLRSRLEREEVKARGRNGVIAGEWALAGTLRWLAGASIYEVMDGPRIAKSTAYHMVSRTLDAINECKQLKIRFPEADDELRKVAVGFRLRSSQDVIRHCVGAADGLLVRRRKPSIKEHPAPDRFFSGHKKAVGMNLQAICDARYKILAACLNTPGSTNDRQAWASAKFDKLVGSLPEPFFVVGDAAYGPSDQMLVPYPGTHLHGDQDAFNFYQSQARMAIEQTFGILVRTWGVLWKPLEVPLRRTAAVVEGAIRLHNFLRDHRSDPVPMSTQPPMNPDGTIHDNVWATPCSRRPPGTQSQLRENMRIEIAARTLVRPAEKVRRNRSWRSAIVQDDEDRELP